MPWAIRDILSEASIIGNIEGGEDRGAAVLAASYLEDRLTSAIHARLLDDKEVVGKMFKGYGPLASFSAKIDLGYLLDMFPSRIRNDLHVIREVRNRFAHRLDVNKFDDKPISDLCLGKLLNPRHIGQLQKMFERTARPQEYAMFSDVVRPLAILPHTPRNAYMSTIKIILIIIEADMQKVLTIMGKPAGRIILVAKPDASPEKP